MKVAVVGHSLIHERQYDFFDWMQKHHPDIELLQIYPDRWGNQTRVGGFPIATSQSMTEFDFGHDAIRKISAFEPDVIYVQQELYCQVSLHMQRLAELLGCASVFFVWENLETDFYHVPQVKYIAKDATKIICGSKAAANLLRPHTENTVVFPQVGVNTTRFCIKTENRRNDLVFIGRNAENKGWKPIEGMMTAHPEFKLERVVGAEYSQMHKFFQRAKVHLSPVLDTPHWKEQWASYANCEALSCGCSVVTSPSECIKEYLLNVPGVYFAEAGNMEDLYLWTNRALEEYETNTAGRKWVVENVSYKAVAQKTYEVLKNAIE